MSHYFVETEEGHAHASCSCGYYSPSESWQIALIQIGQKLDQRCEILEQTFWWPQSQNVYSLASGHEEKKPIKLSMHWMTPLLYNAINIFGGVLYFSYSAYMRHRERVNKRKLFFTRRNQFTMSAYSMHIAQSSCLNLFPFQMHEKEERHREQKRRWPAILPIDTLSIGFIAAAVGALTFTQIGYRIAISDLQTFRHGSAHCISQKSARIL